MVKRMRVAFDGGRMTSEAGISLFAAIEQRLGAGALADSLRTLARPSERGTGLLQALSGSHGPAELGPRIRNRLFGRCNCTRLRRGHDDRAPRGWGGPCGEGQEKRDRGTGNEEGFE